MKVGVESHLPVKLQYKAVAIPASILALFVLSQNKRPDEKVVAGAEISEKMTKPCPKDSIPPPPVKWVDAPEDFTAAFRAKLAPGEVEPGPVKSAGTLLPKELPFPIAPPWTVQRLEELLVPKAYCRLTYGLEKAKIIPLREVMNEHYKTKEKFIRDEKYVHVITGRVEDGEEIGRLARPFVVTLDTGNREILHGIAASLFFPL